jgi:hypothetical protein
MTAGTIYHATSAENIESISIDGLKPGMFGETYFANTAQYAAGFARLYGVTDIVVIPVKVELLEKEKLSVGSDHAPQFFPEDLEVTVYHDHIPSTVIDWETLTAWS